MNSNEAIKALLKAAGLSQVEASTRMGKFKTFISSTLSNSASCQCSTIAALAAVCGYKLVLVPLTCENTDEIVIDS